jgi:eukaryotic-like serine/threonine-protein kinase
MPLGSAGTQEPLRNRLDDGDCGGLGRKGAPAAEGKAAVVGALILNRFVVRERLGSGGFGTVYRAWDDRLEREVAVKVIEVAGDPIDRVLREAQAVARLNHPSIVTLYELGEDGRHAYLVSELVDGATLSELAREGLLSDRAVGELGADLCDALRHAHSRGVVHRDIKPQNILLAADDRKAKLMDFGIASVLDGVGLTATGDVVGTLAYMAPEQADGADAEPAADVYSLALTLYEAWSGENPVAHSTPAATARAIGQPLPPLSEARGDLPLGLCEAIDDCLEADPELRPPLEELALAIDDAVPDLDPGHSVPRPHRPHASLGTVIERLTPNGPAELAAAIAVGVLTAAVMFVTPARGAGWAYLLPIAATLLSLLWPRLGYLLAAGGLAAWLAGPAARPGAALVVGVLALPPALLVGSGGRTLTLPVASPLLGLAGAAPIYPALAGLAGRARDRLVLGAAGYAWLAIAEAVLDRKLLFGTDTSAPHGWQRSAGTAFHGLLLPIATDPAFLFGLALWSLGALALGLVVRGRNPVVDLLGAMLWAAALVAALRLRAGADGPAPAVLAVLVIALVAVVIVWRSRAAQGPRAIALGRAHPPLREPGREATLS